MSKNFIIIEPDPIVRMDLEGMLSRRYAGCHLASGASLQEVGAAIYNCGPDTTLFVKASILQDAEDLTRVLTTAVTRGSQVVILGGQAALSFPATFVDLPFTTDMMIAAVDGVIGRSCRKDGEPKPA